MLDRLRVDLLSATRLAAIGATAGCIAAVGAGRLVSTLLPARTASTADPSVLLRNT